MSVLPRQTPGFYLHSLCIPTSQELLQQHVLLVDEATSNILDRQARSLSITIDFEFEGQRYKGIAYPVEENNP